MKVRVLCSQPQRQRDQQNDPPCRSGAKRLDTELHGISSSGGMVLGLSAAYVRSGGLPWMQGMFYGIGLR
jgi:hypothetical protein